MKMIDLNKSFSPILNAEAVNLFAAMRYYGENKEVLADSIEYFTDEQEAIWYGEELKPDENSKICIEKTSFPTSKINMFEWYIDFQNIPNLIIYFTRKYKVKFQKEEFYNL